MAKPVIMPKLGFTQESSQILRWLKAAGDRVEQGEPIAEVTTDKVNMEVEAPVSGVLDNLQFEEGDEVPVTQVIAYIRGANETLEKAAPAETPPTGEKMTEPGAGPSPEPPPSQTPQAGRGSARVTPIAANVAQERNVDLGQVQGTGPGGRVTRRDVERYAAGQAAGTTGEGAVRAVPAARRAARELGVDLAGVRGTGPRGRVQSADVELAYRTAAASSQTKAATPRQATAPKVTAPGAAVDTGERRVLKTIPLVGMRQTIATRMQASARDAPHITFEADIDMTAAEAMRARANGLLAKDAPRISVTAILIKVCAWALRRHPMVNSQLDGTNILVLDEVNIGVAVALDEGLIVPVVREANRKGLVEIAADLSEIAGRAREGRLRMEDLTGGTFTISNLGMFGVDRFTAILNPPETGILAVGRTTPRVVPDEAGQAVVRSMLTVTLSADHRVVDGAVAGRFLSDVRQALEHPELLVM